MFLPYREYVNLHKKLTNLKEKSKIIGHFIVFIDMDVIYG